MGQLNEDLAREAARSGIKRAVETGTLQGDGAKRLSRMFARVETIELSKYLALRARIRLLRYRNVRLRQGDSAKLLRPSKEPTLYWLDGHWSAGNTAGESMQCPLLDEIRQTSPGTPGDWYLVDDARLFTKPVPPPLDQSQWPSLEDILKTVAAVRPGYVVDAREDLDLIVIKPAD